MIIADTHVHLHGMFPPALFFDQARRNFARAAQGNVAAPSYRILCFTDMAGQDSMARLCDAVREAGGWRFARRDDRRGASATHRDGYVIHLLPGRQIISAENIELLALDTTCSFDDRSFHLVDALQRVIQSGAIPVLPWGFGKWSGARGGVVEQIIETQHDFFLAHNGNRCRGVPAHRIFARAAQRGVPVLSGSDPLPFASESDRAGSSGIIGNVSPMPEDPHDAFRRLVASHGSWHHYGDGVSPVAFLRNQLGMQLRNIRRPR